MRAEAAAVPDGAMSALACLRRGGVRPGVHVLVYGASGSIGTAAVQLAKHMGARVTAVCKTKNVELIRSLGADEVLDYTVGDDFTENREAYDVVVDAVGKRTLLEDGEYRAVIDRTYPLEDVGEASRYVETQQKTGNVVITVGTDHPGWMTPDRQTAV